MTDPEMRQKVHLLDKKVESEMHTISKLVLAVQSLNTKIEELTAINIEMRTKVNLLWRGGLAVLAALMGSAWMVIKHHLGL